MEFGNDDGSGYGPERLRLALVRPESYLPAHIDLADPSAVLVSDLLYDGLTTFDADRGIVRPGLARGWHSDEDFDRWEFELDTGRGIGAADVARSLSDLRTSANPLVASTAGNIAAVSGDGDRVIVELDHPDPDLPAALSGVAFSIVEASGNRLGPMSSGFTMVSDDSNGMVLRADGSGEPRSAPGISEALITWVDDLDRGYDRLTLGLVDASAVDGRHLDDARSRFGESSPVVNTRRFLLVNSKSPALATTSARRALCAALDVGRLVANGDQAGQWARRDSILLGFPDGAGDRSEEPWVRANSCGVPDLGDSGDNAVLRTITVGFSDDAGEDLAQRVARDLRSTGWVVDLAPVPAGLHAAVADFDVDVVVVDQTWPWPTSSHALAAVVGPGRFLADVEIDGRAAADIVEEIRTTDNAVERAATLGSLHDKLVGSGWLMPLAGGRSMLVRSPAVQQVGFTFDGSLSLTD